MVQSQLDARARIAPIVDLDDAAFDPFVGDALSIGDIADPYPLLHKMAAESWVHPVEFRKLFMDTPNAILEPHNLTYFTVFGYDKCAQLVPDGELFSNKPLAMLLGSSFGATISGMDAPDHARYRRIFQKAFLPHTVKQWGDGIVKPVVDALLDKVAGQGECDLVQDFTFHYPFQVIYRQLNLPPQDAKTFHKLAISQTAYVYAPQVAAEAGQKLGAYFSAMVQARRQDPGEDLVSILATAEVEGERLPENVVVSFLRQLTNAGGDTTYRGTSVLFTALLQNPDQLEAVRQDRSLVGAAIEEALRWDGPVASAARMLTRDAVIDGVTLPKGAWVDFLLNSANRDPAKYPDPDRFDIFRVRDSRPIPFATGPHVCIGQHLAKVEMERALNGVLDRFANLRLDPDKPPPVIRGFRNRAPHNLFVKFDPA